MHNENTTLKLANFVVTVKAEDIPAELKAQMSLHAIDTVAVGLVGAMRPLSHRVRTYGKVRQNGVATDKAYIWGTTIEGNPCDVAFINGVSSHSIEFDDTHGCDHSGAVVIPALMGALPYLKKDPTTDEFLTAMILGYEVARRMQIAFGGYAKLNEKGWHSTSICGPIGAVCAVSRLLRLSYDEVAAAIGICSSMLSGTWSFSSGKGDNKALHAGLAAKNGLESVLMAKSGIKGTLDTFELVWGGIVKTYSGSEGNVSELTNTLGYKWHAKDARIKLYPSCASSHPIIHAFENQLNSYTYVENSSIKAISIWVSDIVNSMCGESDIKELNTPSSRQMSIPYSLALLMTQGVIRLSDYWTIPDSSPRVEDVLQLITVYIDPEYDGASGNGKFMIVSDTKNEIVYTKFDDSNLQYPWIENMALSKIRNLMKEFNYNDEAEELTDLYKKLPTNFPLRLNKLTQITPVTKT
ncbi:MmgE/PrpD family protein [Halomonas sp. NPDC076908]|uniref:MmgE/PrpD family protein n=1 Tax=Halomonas sp. NPDC076908 TaxID=3390567 RepID=UPI003CFBF8D8